MNLRDWIRATSPKVRAEICAQQLHTTPDYLWQIAGGHSRPSARLANAIERATNGAVKREDLRPDVFGPAPDEAAP